MYNIKIPTALGLPSIFPDDLSSTSSQSSASSKGDKELDLNDVKSDFSDKGVRKLLEAMNEKTGVNSSEPESEIDINLMRRVRPKHVNNSKMAGRNKETITKNNSSSSNKKVPTLPNDQNTNVEMPVITDLSR